MGVQDRPRRASRAHDLRHCQRLGVFWTVVEAWRLDRLSAMGQGRNGQGHPPARQAGFKLGRGRVTAISAFSNGRRLYSALMVGTMLGGLAAPAFAQAQPAPTNPAPAATPAAAATAPVQPAETAAPAPLPGTGTIHTLAVSGNPRLDPEAVL